MPRSPRLPSFCQISRGNWFSRSMRAAMGAISSCAKRRTLSRRSAIDSPSSMFNPFTCFSCIRCLPRQSIEPIHRVSRDQDGAMYTPQHTTDGSRDAACHGPERRYTFLNEVVQTRKSWEQVNESNAAAGVSRDGQADFGAWSLFVLQLIT